MKDRKGAAGALAVGDARGDVTEGTAGDAWEGAAAAATVVRDAQGGAAGAESV